MVEDEIHFIFVCPRFSTLRQELFAMVPAYYPPFQWLSTTDKFIYLLISTNVHILREQELMSGEAAKERVTTAYTRVPSKSKSLAS